MSCSEFFCLGCSEAMQQLCSACEKLSSIPLRLIWHSERSTKESSASQMWSELFSSLFFCSPELFNTNYQVQMFNCILLNIIHLKFCFFNSQLCLPCCSLSLPGRHGKGGTFPRQFQLPNRSKDYGDRKIPAVTLLHTYKTLYNTVRAENYTHAHTPLLDPPPAHIF